MEIREEKGVFEYLQKRNILKKYKHQKKRFKDGKFQQIDLKKRKPKQFEAFQFRITKQYRAFGYYKTPELFVVTEISDHQ